MSPDNCPSKKDSTSQDEVTAAPSWMHDRLDGCVIGTRSGGGEDNFPAREAWIKAATSAPAIEMSSGMRNDSEEVAVA